MVKLGRFVGCDSQHADSKSNVCERDHIDMNRAESPLRKADDAVVLNNSDMTIEEQDKCLLDLYHSIISRK